MTIADFATLIGTLAVATGKELDDETTEVYFGALNDIPYATLQAATGRLIKSAKFFPTTGEIRAKCDRVVTDTTFSTFHLPALPPAPLADDDPQLWYACAVCEDSGWASHWCPGSVNAEPTYPAHYVGVRHCGSSACARFGKNGYGHECVVRCVCYSTNPKIRERLESRKKYAEES